MAEFDIKFSGYQGPRRFNRAVQVLTNIWKARWATVMGCEHVSMVEHGARPPTF